MSSLDLPLGVVRRDAHERGLLTRPGALETAVSALVAGSHLVLLAKRSSDGAAVAEMLADTAADCGICFGCITLSSAAGRLLTSSDIVAERFEDDVWLIARDADEQGLRRIDNYVHVLPRDSHWRALVVTELVYSDVVRAFSHPGRRRFVVLDL